MYTNLYALISIYADMYVCIYKVFLSKYPAKPINLENLNCFLLFLGKI